MVTLDTAPPAASASDSVHERERAWLRTLLPDAAWVLGGFVAAGLLGGVLWVMLCDPAAYTMVRGRAAMGEAELGRQFGADAWFALLGLGLATVTAFVLTAIRHLDPLRVLLLSVVGACAAAALMALLGLLLGPPDPDVALKSAASGSRVPLQLTVDAASVYLFWPIGAMIGHAAEYWFGFSERGHARHLGRPVPATQGSVEP